MERLTQKSDKMIWFKDQGLKIEPCEMNSHHCRMILEKLADYEDLEEQGLLVRLPCKVGTEVFAILPRDSHCTKCQIKKNRNPSNYIWKNMLLCRASCTKGMLLQIF